MSYNCSSLSLFAHSFGVLHYLPILTVSHSCMMYQAHVCGPVAIKVQKHASIIPETAAPLAEPAVIQKSRGAAAAAAPRPAPVSSTPADGLRQGCRSALLRHAALLSVRSQT